MQHITPNGEPCVKRRETPAGEGGVVQSRMDEESSIAALRRENFGRLFPPAKFSLSDLVQAFGRTPAFWSDLRHKRKSFGEKLARSLEETAGLAPGELDRPAATRLRGALSDDVLAHLETLPAAEVQRAEALLRVHLGMPADAGSKHPTARAA